MFENRVNLLEGLIATFLPSTFTALLIGNISTSTLLNVLLDLAVLFCFISTIIAYIWWGLLLIRENRQIESTDIEKAPGLCLHVTYSSQIDKIALSAFNS